jgi:hypothetical protein
VIWGAILLSTLKKVACEHEVGTGECRQVSAYIVSNQVNELGQ